MKKYVVVLASDASSGRKIEDMLNEMPDIVVAGTGSDCHELKGLIRNKRPNVLLLDAAICDHDILGRVANAMYNATRGVNEDEHGLRVLVLDNGGAYRVYASSLSAMGATYLEIHDELNLKTIAETVRELAISSVLARRQ